MTRSSSSSVPLLHAEWTEEEDGFSPRDAIYRQAGRYWVTQKGMPKPMFHYTHSSIPRVKRRVRDRSDMDAWGKRDGPRADKYSGCSYRHTFSSILPSTRSKFEIKYLCI